MEEGKKATVQEGFNVGFREGATAGLAYGQARGAACSVAALAGQMPGAAAWADAIASTSAMVAEMTPADAVASAREALEIERAEEEGERRTPAPDSPRAGFAERMAAARDEIRAAGFELRDFELD